MGKTSSRIEAITCHSCCAAILTKETSLERENIQTARIFVWLIAASFLQVLQPFLEPKQK
jgi:hypothetical protein